MDRFADKLLLNVAPWLAAKLINWVHRRIRPVIIGDGALKDAWARGENVIISFWHDQLFLMAKGYHGPGANVLISASKDGELIARTMGYFDIQSVRGSSNRGGRAAFKEMLALSREPIDLVFTPDGPKGPRHKVKEGVAQLARMTGRPIVPMAFACSRGHRFASWDRFLLPYPFGRGVYAFGELLTYTKEESPESFRVRVEEAMRQTTLKAVDYLNKYGLSAV